MPDLFSRLRQFLYSDLWSVYCWSCIYSFIKAFSESIWICPRPPSVQKDHRKGVCKLKQGIQESVVFSDSIIRSHLPVICPKWRSAAASVFKITWLNLSVLICLFDRCTSALCFAVLKADVHLSDPRPERGAVLSPGEFISYAASFWECLPVLHQPEVRSTLSSAAESSAACSLYSALREASRSST